MNGRRVDPADDLVELVPEAHEVVVEAAPGTGQRRRTGRRGEREGAGHGHGHEGQAAAHEEARDVAGIADAAAHPARPLLDEVGAHEQQE